MDENFHHISKFCFHFDGVACLTSCLHKKVWGKLMKKWRKTWRNLLNLGKMFLAGTLSSSHESHYRWYSSEVFFISFSHKISPEGFSNKKKKFHRDDIFYHFHVQAFLYFLEFMNTSLGNRTWGQIFFQENLTSRHLSIHCKLFSIRYLLCYLMSQISLLFNWTEFELEAPSSSYEKHF